MSPNMACEALQSFSPKLSLAKRKEALQLRKVSEVTKFSFISLNILPHTSHMLWWMNTKFCVLLFQTMKPLMEKRRRARINESLNRLKNLIIPLTGRDVSCLNLHFQYAPFADVTDYSQHSILTHTSNIFSLLSPALSLLQAWESRHPGNDRAVPRWHSTC